MRIDQSTVFQFRFPFMNGLELGFPVAAPNQHEAAQALKHWFEEAQKELAIMFPQVSPEAEQIPPAFNQLQMGLLEDLSSKLGRKGEPLADFVREKTGYDLTIDNFKLIVPVLEGTKPPHDAKKKA